MQKMTGDVYKKKTLNLSISGLKLVMLGLVIIQVFLTITIYNFNSFRIDTVVTILVWSESIGVCISFWCLPIRD